MRAKRWITSPDSLYERKSHRDRLMEVAEADPDTWAVGFMDECWCSRLALSTLQKMLGHSDIRMTLAIYTYATDEMQDVATAALESAFS